MCVYISHGIQLTPQLSLTPIRFYFRTVRRNCPPSTRLLRGASCLLTQTRPSRLYLILLFEYLFYPTTHTTTLPNANPFLFQDGSSKLPSFNKVVAGGFGLAALLCGTIMSGGFLTFGGAAQGLILNNYVRLYIYIYISIH